jgi:hypothetical protein
VPYEHVVSSEESKEHQGSESSSKYNSSNITPYKQLETIIEQATDLEMDNTN